ncbi:hypothetical protein [Maridesulfovibrio sp.]|uniref:hypothetical protein n=1 Tax=Maridesulfovibrio sp. TaxID=2795000 RepID=UPI0029F46CDC|nr:hypothetical protein [Maridesulfovibrio sp.]
MNEISIQTFRSLSAVLIVLALAAPGCSFFYKPIEQAHEYTLQKKYDAAVAKLTDIIDSDYSEAEKAQAFMLRGQAYSSLKEYRRAYRDLQVAWKLSCHLYQSDPSAKHENVPATQNEPQSTNATAQNQLTFSSAKACIKDLPFLIDELKPFTSEFGAIMATQEASAIVKEMFPELPR